jgi:hypothetical protein
MSFLIYMIITIVGSSLVSAVSLHTGAAFVGFVLGKGDSLDSRAINGCNWWPWSVVISGIVAALLWKQLGSLGLVSILAGPLFTIVLAGISLKATSTKETQQEFLISNRTIRSVKEDRIYQPRYFINSAAYCTTGPATGYQTYCIELRDQNGELLATNNYLSGREYKEDFHRLAYVLRLPTLDIVGVFESDEKEASELLSVNGELLHIMLKNLETFPPESQKWWTALLTPNLGERQVLEFSAQEIIPHLSAFTRYELDPIIKSNVMNTLELLKKDQSKVRVMHWDFYQESMGSRQAEPE